MMPRLHTSSHALEIMFLALQAIVVVFLLFHDWIPLGRLNNLAAIRRQDTLLRRVFVTLLPGVPAGIGSVLQCPVLRATLSTLAGDVAVDHLRLVLAGFAPGLVDTLPCCTGPAAGRSLSGDLCQHPLVPASAQWNCAGHPAYYFSPRRRRHRARPLKDEFCIVKQMLFAREGAARANKVAHDAGFRRCGKTLFCIRARL